MGALAKDGRGFGSRSICFLFCLVFSLCTDVWELTLYGWDDMLYHEVPRTVPYLIDRRHSAIHQNWCLSGVGIWAGLPQKCFPVRNCQRQWYCHGLLLFTPQRNAKTFCIVIRAFHVCPTNLKYLWTYKHAVKSFHVQALNRTAF